MFVESIGFSFIAGCADAIAYSNTAQVNTICLFIAIVYVPVNGG
jgi:hypothetical protein